jgi:hypothetical protein
VTSVMSYSSSLDSGTGMLTVGINVQTANGPLAISTSIPVGGGFGVGPFGEEFGS